MRHIFLYDSVHFIPSGYYKFEMFTSLSHQNSSFETLFLNKENQLFDWQNCIFSVELEQQLVTVTGNDSTSSLVLFKYILETVFLMLKLRIYKVSASRNLFLYVSLIYNDYNYNFGWGYVTFSD